MGNIGRVKTMDYEVSIEFDEPDFNFFEENLYTELMKLLGETEMSEIFINSPIVGSFSTEDAEEDDDDVLRMSNRDVLNSLLETENFISEDNRKIVEFLLEHIKEIAFHLIIED
jgi:hypothetical protein